MSEVRPGLECRDYEEHSQTMPDVSATGKWLPPGRVREAILPTRIVNGRGLPGARRPTRQAPSVRLRELRSHARSESRGEMQRLRPEPQGPLDLLPVRLAPGVRVIAGHPQAGAGRRPVAQGLLADQRVDVGVLEQRGERVPP